MNDVTGIIVSYNTKTLLRNCVDSIREFYPDLKLIIVDGSAKRNACYIYSKSLNSKTTRVINVEYNIGHGKGMKLGISVCPTKYFVLIDSDIIMTGKPLERMRRLMDYEYYGVGNIIGVDRNGNNCEGRSVKYLHPYFAMINKEIYIQHAPIIHHGAPMIDAMMDLHTNKKASLLRGFDLKDTVIHLGRGTRLLNPPDFNPRTWAKVAY